MTDLLDGVIPDDADHTASHNASATVEERRDLLREWSRDPWDFKTGRDQRFQTGRVQFEQENPVHSEDVGQSELTQELKVDQELVEVEKDWRSRIPRIHIEAKIQLRIAVLVRPLNIRALGALERGGESCEQVTIRNPDQRRSIDVQGGDQFLHRADRVAPPALRLARRGRVRLQDPAGDAAEVRRALTGATGALVRFREAG